MKSLKKFSVVAASSSATLTPPDAVSTDTTAEFGTMPFEVPMEKLVELVKEAVQENAPLAQAMEQLREHGHPELPRIEVPQEPKSFETRRRDDGGPRSAADEATVWDATSTIRFNSSFRSACCLAAALSPPGY